MEIWEYILLFICVLIGGSVALYYKKYQQRYLNHLLTFSGAYIMGIAVLHLMPEAFDNGSHYAGTAMLFGFFVQLLLEQLSGGVEHGHIHPHGHRNYKYLYQVVLGLCLHAFFEGLPLGNYAALECAHAGHDHGAGHLLYGIILHKAPAAFALSALLVSSGFRNKEIIICLIIFASMSPLGAGLAEFLGETGWWDCAKQKLVTAFVVGSFLHIATTILFETESGGHHKLPLVKVGMIAIGLLIAFLTIL